MSSRSTRTLVGYAPDGAEVTLKTSGGYDYAGIVRSASSGKWSVVEKGSVRESVRKRTQTTYSRTHSDASDVVALYEPTAEVVAQYFHHHGVIITGYHIPGQLPETGRRLHGTRKVIRDLAARGATQVSFEQSRLLPEACYPVSRGFGPADFTMDELLRSMGGRRPTVPVCATVGHSSIPATHEISYSYRGEPGRETAYTCSSCTESYSQRVVLVDFEAEELHAGRAK